MKSFNHLSNPSINLNYLQAADPQKHILGILGGGQLGRMFVQAASKLGFQTCVFCPENREDSPAASVSSHHIQAEFTDEKALEQFGKLCFAVSTEFENIPCHSLEFLANFTQVRPDHHALTIAQNRFKEKSFCQQLGIEVAPFCLIDDLAKIEAILSGNSNDEKHMTFPAILKTMSMGYDGKGQQVVHNWQQVKQAYLTFNAPCILETFLDLDHEVSVILARNAKAETKIYPIGKNTHIDGILSLCEVPSPATSDAQVQQAKASALKIAEALNYVGILCVEFFVLKNGQVIVNELAPRPHNSGHYTMDACGISQFCQQVCILANWPLGSTELLAPAAKMFNLFGDAWLQGKSQDEEPLFLEGITQHAGLYLHLYGKKDAKIGRKMGHVNMVEFNVLNTDDLNQIFTTYYKKAGRRKN